VPISLSLLLLTAAFLKGYELYAVPLPEASVWSSRAFRIGVIEAEGFLALWLLSGLGARLARSAALAAFHVFFTVSLSQAVAGKESCGCFGRVPVDPRGTAALDFIAILALWLWRPDVRPGSAMGPRSPRLAGMLLLFLLVGIPGGMVLAARWPDIEADGSVVVLRPEKWVDRRCPLLPYADIGDDLSRGRWLVVLYRHNCPHCRDVVPLYEAKARAAVADSAAPRIAFLAVPPHGPPLWKFAPGFAGLKGRLTESKEWFGATPAVLRLQDGVVQTETAQP
jgi:integrase